MRRMIKYEKMLLAIENKLKEHERILDYLHDKYRIVNKHNIINYNEAIISNIDDHRKKVEALSKYRNTIINSYAR